jgi:hypothetical protein
MHLFTGMIPLYYARRSLVWASALAGMPSDASLQMNFENTITAQCVDHACFHQRAKKRHYTILGGAYVCCALRGVLQLDL